MPKMTKLTTRVALGLVALVSASAMTAASAKEIVFPTPDNKELARATNNLEDGFHKDAVKNFERAAEYGNKAAQTTLAMMYLKGAGVESDWVKGYAWAVLAASQGEPEAVRLRDDVYAQLKDAEKKRAKRVVEHLQEEYGDLVALERREEWMRKQKRETTGSRTGQNGAVRIQVSDPSGYVWEMSGPLYYQQLEQEYITDFRAGIGEVHLRELELADD